MIKQNNTSTLSKTTGHTHSCGIAGLLYKVVTFLPEALAAMIFDWLVTTPRRLNSVGMIVVCLSLPYWSPRNNTPYTFIKKSVFKVFQNFQCFRFKYNNGS